MAERDEDTGIRESGEGTYIGPEDVAVVVGPDGSWQMLFPKDDDMDVPEQAIALVAAAMRLTSDSEFYRDILEWYAENHDGPEEDEGEPGARSS